MWIGLRSGSLAKKIQTLQKPSSMLVGGNSENFSEKATGVAPGRKFPISLRALKRPTRPVRSRNRISPSRQALLAGLRDFAFFYGCRGADSQRLGRYRPLFVGLICRIRR